MSVNGQWSISQNLLESAESFNVSRYYLSQTENIYKIKFMACQYVHIFLTSHYLLVYIIAINCTLIVRIQVVDVL